MAARPPSAMLWLTILAAPAALVFETLLRHLLFPPEFEEVRAFAEPLMTPVAWGLAVLAALAAMIGLIVQQRAVAGRLAKLDPRADADARYRAVFGVFLLSTAVPQIPAIVATFGYTFGASLAPVVVAIALSSVGVLAQALRIGALSRRA